MSGDLAVGDLVGRDLAWGDWAREEMDLGDLIRRDSVLGDLTKGDLVWAAWSRGERMDSGSARCEAGFWTGTVVDLETGALLIDLVDLTDLDGDVTAVLGRLSSSTTTTARGTGELEPTREEA